MIKQDENRILGDRFAEVGMLSSVGGFTDSGCGGFTGSGCGGMPSAFSPQKTTDKNLSNPPGGAGAFGVSFSNLQSCGDLNSNELGSGVRYDKGKVRYDLIPTHLLESTARVFEYGAQKYSSWNWCRGMAWSKVIGCMKRHLAAIERGEDIDAESGLPHIGHLMCNALMLEHYRTAYKEGDDRPAQYFTTKT